MPEAPTWKLPPIGDRLVSVDGVNLRVRTAGVDGAPVALLLHGFPESWYGWRSVLEPIFKAGYQVVMPDLRGFGKSDKPTGKGAYDPDAVVADLLKVLDAFGAKTASVVGFDLGGQVAWRLAAAAPTRVEKLVVLGSPHPSQLRSLKSLLPAASWTSLLTIPALFAWVMPQVGFKPIEWTWLAAMKPGAVSDADLQRLRDAWGREGALHALGAWYGARWGGDPGDVSAPTLVITGERDRIVFPEVAEAAAGKVRNGKHVTIPGAGHWVHMDAPEATADAIVAFLGVREFQKSWRPRQW